jgi:hypothetical protein
MRTLKDGLRIPQLPRARDCPSIVRHRILYPLKVEPRDRTVTGHEGNPDAG